MKNILVLACIVFCVVALGACNTQSTGNETEPYSLESQAQSQATFSSEQAALGTTPNATAGATQFPEAEWIAQNQVIPSVLPTLAPESMQPLSIEQLEAELWPVGESPEGLTLNYRYCYYNSHGSFWTLVPDVDPDEYYEWLITLPRTEDFYPNGTAQEMPLVTLVKHFQVPKHIFVAEVERQKQARLALGDDLSDELYELPNADIIYTFDNEIINEYYRRQ